MITCALYLRISEDQAGEGLAVSRQRELCSALATARGWTVVEVYTEKPMSASKRERKRPAYDRLVADYEAGRFGAIVSYDLDRLTRQPRQLEDWLDAAESRGLLLVTANGEADLSTDAGRLFARIKIAVARAEIERKGQRQRDANAQKVALGRPIGKRALGYTWTGEVIEAEKVIVEEIYRQFLAGNSLHGIVAELRKAGASTYTGSAWSTTSVRQVLKNPRYAGRQIYHGELQVEPGGWDRIVDADVFDAVQVKITDPDRVTNRTGTHRRHLGSGLFRCTECSGVMYSATSSVRLAYRCPRCGLTRSGPKVDAYIKAIVELWLDRHRIGDLIRPEDSVEGKRIAAEIETLQRRKRSHESDYDAGLITGIRLKAALARVDAELDHALARQAELVADRVLAELLSQTDPAAVFQNAPMMVQRSVIAALGEVYLARGRRGYPFDPDTIEFRWRTAAYSGSGSGGPSGSTWSSAAGRRSNSSAT